jgi:hypothetical protein
VAIVGSHAIPRPKVGYDHDRSRSRRWAAAVALCSEPTRSYYPSTPSSAIHSPHSGSSTLSPARRGTKWITACDPAASKPMLKPLSGTRPVRKLPRASDNKAQTPIPTIQDSVSGRHHRKGGIGPSNASMEFLRAVTLNGF